MDHAEGGSTQQVAQQDAQQVTDQVTNPVTDPVTPPVTSPVGKLLEILGDSEISTSDLMAATGISDRMNLREYYRYPRTGGGSRRADDTGQAEQPPAEVPSDEIVRDSQTPSDRCPITPDKFRYMASNGLQWPASCSAHHVHCLSSSRCRRHPFPRPPWRHRANGRSLDSADSPGTPARARVR